MSRSFRAASWSDNTGVMGVKTTAECESVGGSCGTFDSCDLTTGVLTGSCDDEETYDGCCISKVIVCDAKNGSFVSEAVCANTTGYVATGLHLGTDACCAPQEGNGTGDGQGNGTGNGNGNRSGGMSVVLSHGMQMPVTMFCLYCVLRVFLPHYVDA